MKALTISILLTLTAAVCTTAQAQQAGPHDRPIRDPYITSSGATVDKPGEPQGSAPTPLDRRIQRQDNKIDNSLCQGC